MQSLRILRIIFQVQHVKIPLNFYVKFSLHTLKEILNFKTANECFAHQITSCVQMIIEFVRKREIIFDAVD